MSSLPINIKITFNLGNGKDILEISNCMGLTKEENEYINLLDVWQAIISLKGRVFAPLHVAFPMIQVRKGLIQDDDILQKYGGTKSSLAQPEA